MHLTLGEGQMCIQLTVSGTSPTHCRNGKAFSDSCSKALEPEDVTLGLVVGKAEYKGQH